MEALHYYIQYQAQNLSEEIRLSDDLLRALTDEIASMQASSQDSTQAEKLKNQLEVFNLRKKIELEVFNEKLAKKQFDLHIQAEGKRIRADLELMAEIKSLNLDALKIDAFDNLEKSLTTASEKFVVEGSGRKIFNVFKKLTAFLGESWDTARGFFGEVPIMEVLGATVSGCFDLITFIGESIVSWGFARKAEDKIDIAKGLNSAVPEEAVKAKYKKFEKKELSQEKIDKYKDKGYQENKLELQKFRRRVAITNFALAAFGILLCSVLIVAGVLSFIGIAAATLGTVSTVLTVGGPLMLATIYGTSLWRSHRETKQAELNFDNIKKTQPSTNATYIKYEQKLKESKVDRFMQGVEFGASAVAVVGMTMLSLTILGIASFGVVPGIILVSGAAVALVSAVFAYFNEKANYRYTDWISNKWDQLRGKKVEVIDKSVVRKNTKDNIKGIKFPVIDATNTMDLTQLDNIYKKLHGKEKKRFRYAAWEKIEGQIGGMDNRTKRQYLTEVLKHDAFSAPRKLGLFACQKTSTAKKIEAAIPPVKRRRLA